MSMIFRKMRDEDLDAVYMIEKASFSEPWLREFFENELKYDSYVVVLNNEIIGYICTMQVLDECTITNISVRQDFRRQGIAGYIFKNLFDVMDQRNVKYYYLEVRESNEAALKLYYRLGFFEIGTRKDYYRNPLEDAKVMTLSRNLE